MRSEHQACRVVVQTFFASDLIALTLHEELVSSAAFDLTVCWRLIAKNFCTIVSLKVFDPHVQYRWVHARMCEQKPTCLDALVQMLPPRLFAG